MDPISPLVSPPGIVNQKMDLCAFFYLIIFGVVHNFKKFLKYLMQLYLEVKQEVLLDQEIPRYRFEFIPFFILFIYFY